MASREINEDIDEYISRRRETRYKPIVYKNREVDLSVDKPLTCEEKNHLILSECDKPVVIKKKTWWQRIFGSETEEEFEEKFVRDDGSKAPEEEIIEELEKIEVLEKQEEIIEEERKGIVQRLFEKVGLLSNHTEEEPETSVPVSEEEVPRVDPDLIRVLCIADDLLSKLPREEKIKFLKTEEFLLYKSVFQRYRIKELGRQ